MKKEYGTFNADKTQQTISQWDLDKIKAQKEIFEKRLADNVFPVKNANGKWYKKDFFVSLVNALEQEIANRTKTDQENAVPEQIVENPTPTMAKETDPETSNAGETNVKKVLHKKSPKTIDKPKKNNYINNTNKTKTTKTGDKTMKLNNTEITANIEQLTNKVNELLERIAILEGRNTENHQFKKLNERKHEEVPKSVKVEPKKVIKKANNEQKAEIVKLQKRAQKAKKSLTKKQLAQYTRMWHAKWQEINKTIDINDKAARSLAFAKGRISCLKKARTY